MEYRNLGRTGVKVSPICLGAMMFGWRTEQDDAQAIIAHALDAGINFIDTANVYARGRSEEFTGAALKNLGKRNEVVLATKVHGEMGKGPNDMGNSRRHIIEQCEASLRRLGTDYIDLYQIHRPQPEIPIDETLRALDDLVRSGKVRYLGASTFAAWQIVESLWVSHDLGLNRFVCEQPPYHILDRRIERELLPAAATFGLGVMPWSPLAGGLLSGKYKRGESLPENSRFARLEQRNPGQNQERLNERVYDTLDALTPIAEEKGCTLSQFALAWCINQPNVTSPIIGPRTMEQLEDNLGALELELTDKDRSRVDEAVAPGEAVSAFYEGEWGPHPFRV